MLPPVTLAVALIKPPVNKFPPVMFEVAEIVPIVVIDPDLNAS